MGLLSRSCLVVVVVVLLVPAVLAACTDTTDPCPDDACATCTAGDFVPDPKNCHKYYVCINTTDHTDLSFDCDDGEVFVFNATYQKCVQGAPCKPCPTKPASCHYECSEATSTTNPKTMPSFRNCNSYYECDAADKPTTYKTCDDPTKPFFDGEICQEDETHCCHCHPYCFATTAPGTLIVDPLDCRRYYLCLTQGENPTSSGTCDDGKNFDSVLGGCSETAACDTQCTNVLGADGCIEPFTCQTTGYFARCPGQCTPDYYRCTVVTSEYQDVLSCGEGYFFHPDDHTCVLEDQCP